MRPFQINERKKNVQLKPNDFDLKGFFHSMLQSPDSMYSKLCSLLDRKDVFRLHAFVELGGISQIYEWLTRWYGNNEQQQIIKWLKILNHEHFPIDTSLIGELGLGTFINKQIKNKWESLAPLTTLTGQIEQKWYRFAKMEKEAHSKRIRSKKVVFPDAREEVEKQIRFRRNDKPSQLLSRCKQTDSNALSADNPHSGQSILRKSSASNDLADGSPAIPDIPGHEYHENGNEWTMEYVDIEEDHDIEMSNNSNTEEEDEEDIDFMIEEVPWHRPLAMHIECGRTDLRTDAVKMEERRIQSKEAVAGSQCIELDSAKVVGEGVNALEVVIKTDYPHWSDIERYRKEHDIY